MLSPTTLTLASLESREKHLHSAQIRVCGWEKKPWPFHGYTASEIYGGFPAIAHWTNRRVIIEPEKITQLEKLITHAMTHLVEHVNPLAGKMAERRLETAEKFTGSLHESAAYLSIPHTAIEKYQRYQRLAIYVQILLLESVNDAQTLCFAAWEMNTSIPRYDEIIEIGNALVAKART